VPQLVLQVALQPVSWFPNRPFDPRSSYASALLVGRRRLLGRCLIQVGGSSALQPAFGLRWEGGLTAQFGW
jgi:hypothetical protein